MTSHWLTQVALLAVLLFWIVGAYNRLLRMRNSILRAWDQIVEALARRSEAMAVVMALLRAPLAAEAGTLQALAEADAKQRGAADGVRQSRARVADVALWVGAEAGLASPASRLRALVELQPALVHESADGPRLAQALADWKDAEPRLAFARQGYNDAVDRYNRAIHLFPTRLLTSPMRFRVAGRV